MPIKWNLCLKSGTASRARPVTDGGIILEYLLPYTPELNPVEILYREIKRRLSARMFKTLDDMQSVRKMFARREILPIQRTWSPTPINQA